MAFSQAVSGLNAAATNLDVIGNNIANSATYGFKSGTASFLPICLPVRKWDWGKSCRYHPGLYRWHDYQHRARSGRCYQPERFFPSGRQQRFGVLQP